MKNSDVSDLSIDLDESKGTYVLEIKSKTILAGDRMLIRRRGRDWVRIVFVVSVVLMIIFIVPGMLVKDATTGRSLVYIGLWPSIVANTLGARYAIKRMMSP
jgi:hypothetical protein